MANILKTTGLRKQYQMGEVTVTIRGKAKSVRAWAVQRINLKKP